MGERERGVDGVPPVSVAALGRSVFDPIWAEREHTDARSELVHVLRGQVRIETPDYSIVGGAGDTLYTPARMPHRDVFERGTVFEVYLLQFDWAQEASVLERLTPAELSRASAGSRTAFGNAFDQLYREFVTELPYQRMLVNLRAGQILYELCRAAAMRKHAADEATGHDRRRRIMVEACRLIDQWLGEPIGLEELAEAVGVSPYYLSRVFSQERGFTLSSYVTQRRMERAQWRLAQTDEPIKQIAYAVGYRDSHYFSRVFRRHFHVSPSAYRRQVGR